MPTLLLHELQRPYNLIWTRGLVLCRMLRIAVCYRWSVYKVDVLCLEWWYKLLYKLWQFPLWVTCPDRDALWSTGKHLSMVVLELELETRRNTLKCYVFTYSLLELFNSHLILRFKLYSYLMLLANKRIYFKKIFMSKSLQSISYVKPRSKWPWCDHLFSNYGKIENDREDVFTTEG